MAPGSFNGKNYSGLHSGCGKKTNLGVYSLDGIRYERIPHRKFKPKTMVNIKSLGLRGIVMDKRGENCPRSLIKVYIPDLNEKRYFYTNLLELRGKMEMKEVEIKQFSDKEKEKYEKYLEKKKNRELEVEDIKKEKNELRRKIKEGKKLFKEEIMNGISIDKNDIYFLKSEYNIINDINKDRYLKLQEIKKNNNNIRMGKDKIRLDVNKLSQHGSFTDLYEKIVTREDFYDYVKMFLEELN